MNANDPAKSGTPDPPVPPIMAPPQIHSSSAGLPPGANPPARTRSHGWTAGFIALSALLLIPAVCVIGITGYFRLSSETAALRRSVMTAIPGQWDKTVALRVGWFTTALVRTGSRFFNMPPEPRAALDAVHGAEVGVYKLRDDPAPADFRKLFASADRAMKWRGWDRIVGVAKEHQFVAVYLPHGKVSPRGVRCCVVVFEGHNLVIAKASGNLEPLLKLAEEHMDMGELRHCLPKGI